MKDLTTIPNVGKKTKQALLNIGITCVEDLVGKDPEELYTMDCMKKGFQEDRCQLYLKWWYWKDKEYPEQRG